MNLEISSHDTYSIISFKGSLSVENLNILEETLSKYYIKEHNIIIDLENISFIDSSSLGILVVYYTRLMEINKKLIVVKVNEEIKKLLEMTGISKKILIARSVDEALALLD